jgi:hypothetical protein
MVARPGEYTADLARIMTVMRRALFLVLLCAGSPAAAEPKKLAADEVDIAAYKSKLVFLHDGRGHYVAVVAFEAGDHPLFYGDGKTFYQQRVFGYSHNTGEVTASLNYWAPTSVPRGGELSLEGGIWTVRCSDRKTPLIKLDEVESGKLLERAVFKKVMWKRQAHTLARDDDGTYYYVDSLRDDRPHADQWDDPHPPTGFRIFVGRKGKLREQKITDTAVDSKGVVLTTRAGRLSVDDSTKRAIWGKGKKRDELVYLTVEDNLLLIYRDLGIYGKLGVPCDAL